MFKLNSVKNMKGLSFYPTYQANKLACHSFKDAGIRKKFCGSETKYISLHAAIIGVSESSPPCSVPWGSTAMEPRDAGQLSTLMHNGEQDKTGIRRSGNPDPLKRAISKPATSLHPGGSCFYDTRL